MLPPAVPKFRVIRSIPRTARNPIPVFGAYLREFGPNFILSVGSSRRTHFTADPVVIEHVLRKHHRNYEKSEIQTDQMAKYLGRGLLTNTGQDWLTQRRLIQPGFHRQRLAALVREMQGVIAQQLEALAQISSRGGAVDLGEFTRETAFRIIARAIFTDGFTTEQTAELSRIIDAIQAFLIYPIRVPFLRQPLRWFGLEGKYLRLSEQVRRLIQQRIDARRREPSRDDLLQMLLDSRYEDTTAPMTDEQLIDEIIILFAAGHETSANSLAWTLWLLHLHPPEQTRAREEVTGVRGSDPLGLDRTRQLTYLTQVIEESMRLYPPAWITDRVALADDEVGGLRIEKGTVVGIYIYGLHRNPAIWSDPASFHPDRMAPAAHRARHPLAFLPFGAGPRLCIGNHFALLEMQLFLGEFLHRFDYSLSGEVGNVNAVPKITLDMDRRVGLRVEPTDRLLADPAAG